MAHWPHCEMDLRQDFINHLNSTSHYSHWWVNHSSREEPLQSLSRILVFPTLVCFPSCEECISGANLGILVKGEPSNLYIIIPSL